MGFFYRPAGGGGGNDLTVPTGSVTLDSNTDTYSVNLVNTGTTPASVELSFQNSRMKGLNPDSGTEASPTYVVDPDVGSRSITIKRTETSTSSQAEKVTFTSNQGSTSFLDFTLDPLNLHLSLRLLTSQDPIYEFRFEGNFSDTGTRAQSLTTSGSPVATSDTSDLTGLVGYAEFVSNQYAQMTGTQDINIMTGQARSWVWVARLNSIAGLRIGQLLTTTPSTTAGPIYLRYDSGLTKWQNRSSYTIDYDTSQSHTDGGSSVAMADIDDTEIAILYSHDGSSTITVRWKTLNGNTERTGHSFKSTTQAGKTTLTNPLIFGYPSGGLGADMRHRHFSVYDTALSESDFSTITSIIGFGA